MPPTDRASLVIEMPSKTGGLQLKMWSKNVFAHNNNHLLHYHFHMKLIVCIKKKIRLDRSFTSINRPFTFDFITANTIIQIIILIFNHNQIKKTMPIVTRGSFQLNFIRNNLLLF